MAKVTLDDIASGYASYTKHNSNYDAIEAALENTLSRDGTGPNQMEADLDLNANDLLNVGTVNASALILDGTSYTDLSTAVTNAQTAQAGAEAAEVAAAASASSAAISEANVTALAGSVADLDYLGNWVTATAYKANNIVYVTSTGSSYICLLDHTSGTFATDLSNNKWGILAAQGASGAGTGDMLKSENLSGLTSYATARSNMGLGTISTQDANNVTISGGAITGITDIAVADGGTGASTAADARTNLGTAAEASTQTIWIPAGAMISRTTNGAASGTTETTTNKVMIKTLDFDATTQEFSQFAVRMPKGWNEGTVTAAFVWSHAATTTNFGVVWQLQGVALGDSDALDIAFGTAQTATDTGGTTDDIFISPTTAAITIAGTPQPEDYVLFQVARVPDNGSDTMAIDARLHGITLYYVTTTLNDA